MIGKLSPEEITDITDYEKQKITLYKQNSKGRLKGIDLKRENWVSEEGYEITVETLNEQVTDRTDEVIRLQAVKQFFPDNPPLDEAIQKRALMIGKLSPEEITDITDYEKQKKQNAEEARNMTEITDPVAQVMARMGGAMGGGQPQPTETPQVTEPVA